MGNVLAIAVQNYQRTENNVNKFKKPYISHKKDNIYVK
jgi:hypothetical protein